MIKVDLAIIGGGIAGISAGIYAKRSGLEMALFENKAIGGQLLFMAGVDNYVGLAKNTSGFDLANSLVKHIEDFSINQISDTILKVDAQDKELTIYTQQETYQVKGLIIATGSSFKTLAIPREEELVGKGVSYCAICDSYFFRNKDVAVIGGGNTAVEEALYLSEICSKVYLIHRRDKLRAMQYLQDKLLEKKNIELVYSAVVKKLNGKDCLESIEVEDANSNKTRMIKLSGIFVAIGVKPNTELFKDIIKLDENGFVITDQDMKTSSDYIWAAGDCRNRPLRQLITAASEGAIAAISAYKYLKGHYISI